MRTRLGASSLVAAAEAMDLWATWLTRVNLLNYLESIIGLSLVRKRSVFTGNIRNDIIIFQATNIFFLKIKPILRHRKINKPV